MSTYNKVKKFDRKKQETCPLCGKSIKGNYNRDHVFPRAIAKWCIDEDPTEVISLIYNRKNMVHTHIECNSEKAQKIFSVSSLHVSKFQKRYFSNLECKLTRYIGKFNRLKAHVMELQDGKCRCCGDTLKKDHAILRRFDATKDRTLDNACVVCETCNADHYDFVHTEIAS